MRVFFCLFSNCFNWFCLPHFLPLPQNAPAIVLEEDEAVTIADSQSCVTLGMILQHSSSRHVYVLSFGRVVFYYLLNLLYWRMTDVQPGPVAQASLSTADMAIQDTLLKQVSVCSHVYAHVRELFYL